MTPQKHAKIAHELVCKLGIVFESAFQRQGERSATAQMINLAGDAEAGPNMAGGIQSSDGQPEIFCSLDHCFTAAGALEFAELAKEIRNANKDDPWIAGAKSGEFCANVEDCVAVLFATLEFNKRTLILVRCDSHRCQMDTSVSSCSMCKYSTTFATASCTVSLSVGNSISGFAGAS